MAQRQAERRVDEQGGDASIRKSAEIGNGPSVGFAKNRIRQESDLKNPSRPKSFLERSLEKSLEKSSPESQTSLGRWIVSGNRSTPLMSSRAVRGNAAREKRSTLPNTRIRLHVRRVGSICCVTGSRQCRACEASHPLRPAWKRKIGPSKPRREAYLNKRLTRVYSAPVEARMLRDSYIV